MRGYIYVQLYIHVDLRSYTCI